MVGQTLDHYTIESKLGEGGMGVVYKARDTHLDRVVAIKVLPADKVADPDRRQRFVQEARAASALNHPGIVAIHDIRSDAGIDFIVMEYVAGRTLDQVIAARGLSVTQALRYGVQIADALATAHEAGILHRDLKPANVIVTDSDRVKILDFGLAKLLDPAEGTADAGTRTAPLTKAGTVVGTAEYMSPEQAEGRRVDARSDIFSFGSVLYEMVTGRRPFAGESSLKVLAKILNADPAPPSQVDASVPSDVERAILRCLRKDPARRFQTMADLKVALDDLIEDSASSRLAPAQAPRTGRRWRWAWAAVVPVLIAAGYVAWRAMPSPDSATPLRAVPLTSLPGVVRSPTFSPDGNHVAFTWSGPTQDNPDIYVQQIGAGSPLRLTTDAANDYSPAWSPDGRSIAFLRQRLDPRLIEIRLIPPLGGPDRKLTEIRPHRGFLRRVTLGWCPDSSCVVVTDAQDESSRDAIFVVSAETGEKRQLTHLPQSALADTDPAISPDGQWLVFRRDTAPFNGRLQLLALAGDFSAKGEPRPITPTLFVAYDPEWMPNSREIILSAKSALWRLAIADGKTAERLPFVGEDGLMPAVSPPRPGRPGRLAYVRSFADYNIWRIDTTPGAPAKGPPVAAISSTRREGTPAFSPDGQRVVFNSDRSGESEIWVADSAGTNPVRLTSMGAIPGFGRWSPDGKTIAFHSNPDGNGDVFVVSADGGKPRNLTHDPANDVFPSFTRDGKWIYFSSTRTGEPAIWKIPASGGDAIRVSPGAGLLAIESPDGVSLFYPQTATTDRPGPLVRQSLSSGEVERLPVEAVSTSFTVVEGGIYYIERAAGDTRLMYFDLATHQSTLIAKTLGTLGFGLSATPDGRSILFSRLDSSVDDLLLVENFK